MGPGADLVFPAPPEGVRTLNEVVRFHRQHFAELANLSRSRPGARWNHPLLCGPAADSNKFPVNG